MGPEKVLSKETFSGLTATWCPKKTGRRGRQLPLFGRNLSLRDYGCELMLDLLSGEVRLNPAASFALTEKSRLRRKPTG